MSRYYDALKQASQSLFRSKENEEIEEWGDWQIDGLEVPIPPVVAEASPSAEQQPEPEYPKDSGSLGVASGTEESVEASKVATTAALNSEPLSRPEFPSVIVSSGVLEAGSGNEGSRPVDLGLAGPNPVPADDQSEPGRPAVSELGGIQGSPEAPLVSSYPLTPPAGVEAREHPGQAPHFIPSPQNGHLGTLAKVTLDKKARLIPHMVDGAVVEYYRMLRTKIMQQQEKKLFRSLVVTSPGPQDGKTVTVLNLGLTFAMLESLKVLVIDGDLRRGSLGQWLGVGNRPGLSNLIDGSARLEDVVLKSEEIPIKIIVRGNSKSPAAELLNSPDLAGHFRRMTESFDLVLVDSPPVNLVTDVQLLAGACDAVLLIARAFSTTRKALETAVQDLLPFRVIGTALNAGAAVTRYRRYRSYY